MDSKINKKIVYFPTIKWMKRIRDWNYYFARGFKELGFQIVVDENLDIYCLDKSCLSLTAFDVQLNDKKIRIWYDWSDFETTHLDRKNKNDLYFKVQCTKSLFKSKNVIPIGQIVLSSHFFFDKLSELRKDKRKIKPLFDVFCIAGIRGCKRDYRIKVMQTLKSMNKYKLKVGLVGNELPNDVKINPIPIKDYFSLQTQSKICISFPGHGSLNAFSCRISEALGIGTFCLRTESEGLLPGNAPYKTYKADCSDLVEKIEYWLGKDAERKEIESEGLKYFDKYLTPIGMANTIIDNVEKQI